ncbi:MAG: CCA tRNA nucleotidyltransferase [Candidatus Bathyarchaeia archaeon]
MNTASRVCDSIARQIVPSDLERKRVNRLVEELNAKLVREAERSRLHVEVRLDGSVAKDTWLKGDADIDIFLRVPTSLSRADLETRCLGVARRALKGYPIIERFAEHPYIETHVESVRVNVVPCYNVSKGQWRSATDRTPFHTEYVITHLDPSQRKEVRLLKAFLKGVGVYGADVKVSGFSGMLCETLIMHYRSFTKTLEQAQSWKTPVTIDLEHYYAGREGEMLDLFEEPLIVIDPVDRGRNLAASISRRRLWEFVAGARAFSTKPSRSFFVARKITPLGTARFRQEMQRRGWNLLAIELGRVDTVVDVLWSQLYRTERALRNLLKQEDFNVTRSASWSNEQDLNVILLELESPTLPPMRKHLGPHVVRSQASQLFLRKHLGEGRTVSGPWVDDDRWAVGQLRETTDAAQFIRSKIRDGGRHVGVASKIAPVLKRRHRVLTGSELADFYRRNQDAAEFVTSFLKGRPAWLG